MNCERLDGLAVALVVALMTGAAVVPAAEIGKPTAAFLDVSRKPIGALVEQRLLEYPKAIWLERTEIEKVLQERAISSLLGPAACAERAAVGRILKADLLILLQHVAEPAEYAKLVVCETASGLRLASHSVPLSQKTEDNAAEIVLFARQAIAKHGEEIREICAVPPFISHELSYEYDHLKSAYAKLIEQAIRDRPGLLTVELQEAQAISKEVRLTGAQIRRALPLYVLGEFRHEGKGEGRSLAVRLRVMRGEKPTAAEETRDYARRPRRSEGTVRTGSFRTGIQGPAKEVPGPRLAIRGAGHGLDLDALWHLCDERAGPSETDLGSRIARRGVRRSVL